MKKAEYYIKCNNGDYRKVSGYVEEIADSKGNTVTIGCDKRDEECWIATELNTGLCACRGGFVTKKECVEYVHNHIDIIVKAYNQLMADEKAYNKYVKPFKDFLDANGGIDNG